MQIRNLIIGISIYVVLTRPIFYWNQEPFWLYELCCYWEQKRDWLYVWCINCKKVNENVLFGIYHNIDQHNDDTRVSACRDFYVSIYANLVLTQHNEPTTADDCQYDLYTTMPSSPTSFIFCCWCHNQFCNALWNLTFVCWKHDL